MDSNKICRMCMSSECLNPIFATTDCEEKYSKTIFNSTGIMVHRHDGLPQHMCSDCINKLNSNVTFRILCERTQRKLLSLNSRIDVLATNDIPEIKNEVKRDCDYIKCEIYLPEGSIEQTIEEFCDTDAFTNIGNQEDYDAFTNIGPNDSTTKKSERNKTDHTQRIICKLCGKDLSIRSLVSHMVCRHPDADHGRVKCEMCHKTVLKSRMERHSAVAHGVTMPFLCGSCKAKFDSKEALKEHLPRCPSPHKKKKKKKRAGGVEGKAMGACDVCGKAMQRASVRQHKAVAHSGLGPVCEHCGKRFANKIRLDEHCRAKHGYDKHRCASCPFQSSGRMAMRNHERRHRGEKPFVCEACGAKFHAAYLLAQHKQTHRPDKLIKCPECPASFKANNSLHMHRLTCHSKCTYRCFMCDRTFNCRHYVVKHLRHFHGYQGKVGHVERVEGKPMTEATEGEEGGEPGGGGTVHQKEE